ncbi:PH-like domain-containing protein [Microbacterium gorillae]|uniref:PH-like domain-containing protein n=1 Tax=Microbacterium gorillae TaxID=1231063 RepID=UPI00058FFA16|nr:hypothetical protein [Microbacterium gorillae]
MTKEGAVLVMVGVAALILVLMLWGWRRRIRRDAGLTAPTAPIAGASRAIANGLYVATTAHDAPLERLAVKGMAYRAKVGVDVLDGGVRLTMPGSPIVSIPAAALVGVDRATVAIDRVVERDGLVRISWRIAPDTIVDSYLRLQQTSPTELIAAIETLIPATATTGTDA